MAPARTPAPSGAPVPDGPPGRGVAAARLRALAPGVLLVAPLLVFLVAFYVIPFGTMLRGSFGSWSGDPEPVRAAAWTLHQYERLLDSPRTLRALWRTFEISLISVAITFLLSYPVALLMLRLGPRMRSGLLIVVFVSLASSLIVRNYGWLVVLADQGPVNRLMLGLGLFEHSQRLVYNKTAVIVALVHYCMPFMILPIYGALLRIPASLRDSARVLGASDWTTLRTVVLPLSMPGVFGGTTLCFAICASAFVTPLMLGSPATAMLSQVAAEQLLVQLNFAYGSAMIFSLTVLMFALVFVYAVILRKVLRIDV